MEYTWDKKKKARVEQIHKVNFEKISDVFEDDFSLDYKDDEHSSENDDRLVVVGMTAEYGLFTSFILFQMRTKSVLLPQDEQKNGS